MCNRWFKCGVGSKNIITSLGLNESQKRALITTLTMHSCSWKSISGTSVDQFSSEIFPLYWYPWLNQIYFIFRLEQKRSKKIWFWRIHYRDRFWIWIRHTWNEYWLIVNWLWYGNRFWNCFVGVDCNNSC